MNSGVKAVLAFWAIGLAFAAWALAVSYCLALNLPFVGIPLLVAPFATLMTTIVYVGGRKND